MTWRDARALITRWLMIGVAMVSAPILLYGAFFVYRIGGEYLARRDFDASAWREAGQPAELYRRDATRLRMVDDLLDRYDFGGMKRSELMTLLGESDEARTDMGKYVVTGWDMVYYLGPERGLLGLDSEWLAIRLNEDQRVDGYGVIVP